MKISEMNWMQVEAYLQHDDRAVLPLGSTEQHGYLSLLTDGILAERVAVEAAEPLNVPVFPLLAYGVTPYFRDFPGTVSLRMNTYERIIGDILESLAHSGFRRVVLISGHGGNEPARFLATEWMADHPDVQVKFFQWWRGPKMLAKSRSFDPVFRHASWSENFPWTRVPGVKMPTEQKTLPARDDHPRLVGEAMRQYVGDGNFGGYYQRPDADMQAIWEVAVAETRAVIAGGWD